MEPGKALDFVALSDQISHAATLLAAYAKSQNISQDRLFFDSSLQTPPEILAARQVLTSTSQKLSGPVEPPVTKFLGLFGSSLSLIVCIDFILRWNVASAVPVPGEIEITELATKIGVDVDLCRRVLRNSVLHELFSEQREGYISHSAISLLLQIKELQGCLRFDLDEFLPTCAAAVPAWERWGYTLEPTQTAYSYANKTDKSMFGFLEENPGRRQNFETRMKFVSMDDGLSPSHVVAGLDWNQFGNATVVDVGCSDGVFGLALAEAFPNLTVIGQDLPNVVAEAQKEPLQNERFSYMAHDFFKPQPVQDAAVFLLRCVLHNYSDSYAVKILRNIISAMKPGSKLVIAEKILPAVISGDEAQRKDAIATRSIDIRMMLLVNGKEREEAGWRDLFRQVSPRLRLENIAKPPGSHLSLLCLVLDDEPLEEISAVANHSVATNEISAEADDSVTVEEVPVLANHSVNVEEAVLS